MQDTILSLTLIIAAMTTAAFAEPLTHEDFTLDGWKLTIRPLGETVEIKPPPRLKGECDIVLKEGVPGWRGPAHLSGCAWIDSALRPETLTATLAEDPAVELARGRDFALDPQWATIAAVKNGKYPPGTKVHMTYEYGSSRIDLIERTADGEVVVTEGKPDKRRPLRPAGSPDNTPLAAVYLPNHATRLTPGMILPIDPGYDGVPPVQRRDHLTPVLEKLAGDEPVTIVFFGDSITAMSGDEFADGRGSFVDRFVEYLHERYPGRKIVRGKRDEDLAPRSGELAVINAGVGGDDTRRALRRFEDDVLSHRPDLVVIMFGVNDENRAGDANAVPVDDYRKNLAKMVDPLRERGACVILMTPSMKNLRWSATAGNMHEYAAAMREVAKSKQVALVDAYTAWKRLPERGYHYMVFLGNCINHPVDLGHDLFAAGLQAGFESPDD